MKHQYGDKLVPGYYMMYSFSEGDAVDIAALVNRFEQKYGYTPTEVIVGDGLDVESVGDNSIVFCPPYHIKMR